MPAPGPWRSRLAPWALALVLLASFFVASCSPGLETPDFRGRPAQNVTIPVDVRNQHYSDIVVRVSRGGAWQRIGDVTGNSSERLEIPAAMTGPTGDYQFRVHAIGTPVVDTYRHHQWGLDRLGAGRSWRSASGAGVPASVQTTMSSAKCRPTASGAGRAA